MGTVNFCESARRPAARLRSAHAQRGVVLFIALIVMVALSLAGLALVRSINATTSITGNIAFRQSALLQANWAIEEAIGHIYAADSRSGTTDMITDTTNDKTSQYYVASFDPTKDSTKDGQPALPSGVPEALWKKNGAWPVANPDDTTAGNKIKYVIQRMCTADAVGAQPTQARCEMMQPKQSPASTVGDQTITVKPFPLYRVTVRVDGPNNALTFVQAMIRG